LITCPLQIHARFCFMVVRGRSLNFAIVKLKKFWGAALFLLWNGKQLQKDRNKKKCLCSGKKRKSHVCFVFSSLEIIV
jgi:hypothetical protein